MSRHSLSEGDRRRVSEPISITISKRAMTPGDRGVPDANVTSATAATAIARKTIPIGVMRQWRSGDLDRMADLYPARAGHSTRRAPASADCRAPLGLLRPGMG